MGCFGELFSRRTKAKRSNPQSTPPNGAGTDGGTDGKKRPANESPCPLRFRPRGTTSPDASAVIDDGDNFLPGCDPVRVLGDGTFGTVVLVRERSTKEYFAVKVMSKSQLVHEHQLDNIILERQVLRDAGPHPFVVECHSGFQTADAVVLVLEYLSGGDMYDLMKSNGTLIEAAARFYLAETVVGLAELHRHGFVFRDLKLENILLDSRGHVRLTDFGLAGRAQTPAWDDAPLFDISGTAIYQAPEILSGSGHGALVDWWALGVLAYVLLAGRPPFPNTGTREELYSTIQTLELDLDSDPRLSHVSPTCREFIAALLRKEPARRLGADSDADSVKRHPFFAGVDFDALLWYEAEPPLPPPRAGPAVGEAIAAEQAEHARRELCKKLAGKYRPTNRAAARAVRARGTHIDATEYKPVKVLPSPKSDERRISIGLDFGAQNKQADLKTWTGTTDDFGRNMHVTA